MTKQACRTTDQSLYYSNIEQTSGEAYCEPLVTTSDGDAASQVWNTCKTCEIKTLENVQKFALRMCAKQWSNSYKDLLQLFSQPSLQQRRLYLDLSTVVHGLFYFLTGIFVEQAPRVTRSQSFVCPYAHTSNSYNSRYLILFVAGIHFLHMFPWLVFLYHYL